jgi:FMN phosphatase YigB (HAD superfamily)
MNILIKNVFFDIGSTLVTGPDLSPHKEIAQIVNHPSLTSEAVARIIMMEDFYDPEDLCQRLMSLCEEFSSSFKEKITDLWYRQHNDAVEIDGATPTVKYLKLRGYKIGIISNIWSPYFKSFQKACPHIASLCDSYSLSCWEGMKKPDHIFFKRALSSLNALPQESVIVGDKYNNDIKPAIELGMHTVWVLTFPERERQALVNVINGVCPKPDYAVGCISDVKNLPLWDMNL